MSSPLRRSRQPLPHPARRRFYDHVALNGKLLDIGCIGFREVQHAATMGRADITHHGVDYMPASGGSIPNGFIFTQANLDDGVLPYADDTFDGIVASHVIEHLKDPIGFFAECVRVCKPGGVVYLEAPSERSLLLPGMPFERNLFYSLSYYDDPTHLSRPWTPQSLYRLGACFGCQPLDVGYVTSWKHRLALIVTLPYALIRRSGGWLERSLWLAVGWASYMTLQKPTASRGGLPFNYYYPRGRM